jgi:hypothetical protein
VILHNRLIAPAEEYVATFAPTLRRAQLAWRAATAIHEDPTVSYEGALPQVCQGSSIHHATVLPLARMLPCCLELALVNICLLSMPPTV